MDLDKIMKFLCMRRPIFHLESDFQFALAWEIQTQYPDCDIRLEVPFGFDKRGRIDIRVRKNDSIYPIELKYLKKTLNCEIDGEKFSLAEGVHDMDMYSCMADIDRMEYFCEHIHGYKTGFVIWLTNDKAYWDAGYNASYYQEFHAPDGAIKKGSMYFDPINKKTGKPPQIYGAKGYKNAITLNGSYTINWQDYSDLGIPKGIFKYAIISIQPYRK